MMRNFGATTTRRHALSDDDDTPQHEMGRMQLDDGDEREAHLVDSDMIVDKVQGAGEDVMVDEGRHTQGGLSLRARRSRVATRGTLVNVQRTPNVFEGFAKGSIVRLEMKNFLTFSNVALEPGPKMNLILGPNGTGKSTIVNAICVVFGGSLKLLGRNPNLASYIRHGERGAKLEVRVYDPQARGGVRIIGREIDSEGKSTYSLEGQKVPRKKVDELRKRYDIQLDNLCQFMPQEKISSFSTLRPNDLMSMTVRALGGTEKLDEYNELIASFLNLNSDDSILEEKRKGLEILQKKNEAVKHEVEAYQDHKRIREKLKNMERYRYWVEAFELKVEAEEAKNLYQSVKAEAEKKIMELEAEKGPLLKLRQEKESISQTYKAALRRASDADKRLQKSLADFEKATTAIQLEKRELETLDRENETRAKKVQGAKLQIEKVRAQLSEERDLEVIDKDTNEYRENKTVIKRTQTQISAQIADAETSLYEARQRINSIRAAITELKDVKRQRLQKLEREYPGLSRLYSWVKENTKRFHGPVHGPIYLELGVETPYHARIVEQAVPRWMMAAFVVENEHDHKMIINYGYLTKGGTKPHVVSIPRSINSQNFQPPTSLQEVAHLGIYDYAHNIYSAIDPIKKAINIHVGLHRIAVGDERSLRMTEALVDQKILDRWFTPDSMYSVVVSRYDRNSRSTRVSDLREKTWYLAPGASGEESERISGLQSNLQREERIAEQVVEKVRELKRKCESFEPQIRSTEAELHKLAVEKRNVNNLHFRLEQANRNLKSLQDSFVHDDMKSQKDRLLKRIAKIESDTPKMLRSVVELVTRTKNFIAELDSCIVEKCEIDDKYEKESRRKSDTDEKIKELIDKKMRQKNRYKDRVSARNAKVAEAKTHLAMERLNDEEFLELPRNLEDLDDLIEADRARAQARSGATRDVVEQFERRLKQIEKLEEQLKEDESRCKHKREHLRQRKTEFVAWLSDKVEAMSSIFSRLYSSLGCSGDLVLRNAENMSETYVDIMVSYRESADMIPLNKHVHSGGERMVATMLYHFAMQSLTKAPFRVIDEMNQGMDSDNERRILEIMMQDAENEQLEAPQSFLITPKLLLDLPFNSSTVSHVIINGSMKC